MRYMLRKIALFVLGITLLFGSTNRIVYADDDDLIESKKPNVQVDGESVNISSYNINDNNYFKLRDIAMVLSGTPAQFNVKWDSDKNVMTLIPGEKYETVGGELEEIKDGKVKFQKNLSPIYKNDEKIDVLSYNIKDNNYFKLRDIGTQLGFSVSYDEENKAVLISTSFDSAKGSEKSVGIANLEEYKLKIEYKNDDIEYKYKIEDKGDITAEIDDKINNTKMKGKSAAELIENKLLNLDYSKDTETVINNILKSLEVSKDYKKIKLEIEYKDDSKLEIEIER